MISYEELSAALERYAARRRGEAHEHHAAAGEHEAHHGEHEVVHAEPAYEHAPAAAEPVTSNDLAAHAALGGDDEHTQVGGAAGPRDDHSNEIDIGDVITDDENPT